MWANNIMCRVSALYPAVGLFKSVETEGALSKIIVVRSIEISENISATVRARVPNGPGSES